MQKHHDDRVNGPFLRAIGAMTLAAHELRGLCDHDSGASQTGAANWHEFADHLITAADGVIDGASGSHFPGNTISIARDGVRVAVDVDYVEKLTDKITRHVRIGVALGVGESALLVGESIPA